MITFKDFSFRYEEKEEFTLKHIDIKIQTGEFILLTGRSGCGKTTLIRCLNGLIPHFYPGEMEGDVILDGKSLLQSEPSHLAGKIGTVFQDPRSQFFMTDTTRELAFGCENIGLQRTETIDRMVKAARELQLKDYLNKSIFALSSGEKQQIAIGSIYALAPKVYIFDEPSANLDYEATKRLAWIMKEMKKQGYTILVVEHRFYYLRELIDRAFLIQNGQIEKTFSRNEFFDLSEDLRVSYGLRTAFPEREAKRHYPDTRRSNTINEMEVSGLTFAYKKEPDILQNISFKVRSGDVVGIIGHNGAAIVKDSPVIYFDEPTSGLDYDSMVRVSKLMEQLSDAGVIIFVVSHDFEFIARTCSAVLQLDNKSNAMIQNLSSEVLQSLSKKYFS